MTRKSRYSLIIAGIIIFAIGAPLLVLYVQGKTIHFAGTRTQLTGIISAETSPSGARIVVNDEPKTNTPGAVRFLASGDYTVSLSKSGYRTWTKRLAVIAGRVTHVNPNPTSLVLLKDSPPLEIAKDAGLFASDGKTIFYASPEQKLVLLSKENFSEMQSIALPGPAIFIAADTDSSASLVRGTNFTIVVDSKTLKIADYSKSFATVSNMILSKGRLWGIDKNGQLVASNTANKPAIVIAKGVAAFSAKENDIYYLTVEGVLHHATFNGSILDQDQILASNIPTGNYTDIYTDSAKAVYVLIDKRLLRINTIATEIATNVTKASVASGTLSYTTPGELAWFNSSTNKSQLISRSSQPFTEFYVDPGLQYAFFTQGKELVALELDDNSGQNRYVLDVPTTDTTLTDLVLIDNSTLLYRIGSSLKSLVVR